MPWTHHGGRGGKENIYTRYWSVECLNADPVIDPHESTKKGSFVAKTWLSGWLSLVCVLPVVAPKEVITNCPRDDERFDLVFDVESKSFFMAKKPVEVVDVVYAFSFIAGCRPSSNRIVKCCREENASKEITINRQSWRMETSEITLCSFS